jgi:hypothetical protein
MHCAAVFKLLEKLQMKSSHLPAIRHLPVKVRGPTSSDGVENDAPNAFRTSDIQTYSFASPSIPLFRVPGLYTVYVCGWTRMVAPSKASGEQVSVLLLI